MEEDTGEWWCKKCNSPSMFMGFLDQAIRDCMCGLYFYTNVLIAVREEQLAIQIYGRKECFWDLAKNSPPS